MANPLNSVMKALGASGAKPSPQVRIPQFGPAAGGMRPAPTPMSLGGAPSPSVQDMLSRPKRTARERGYKKTAQRASSAPPKMTKLDSLPPIPDALGASPGPMAGM